MLVVMVSTMIYLRCRLTLCLLGSFLFFLGGLVGVALDNLCLVILEL
jgi:hypothetical protein